MTGHLRKREFGGWVFRAFDIAGPVQNRCAARRFDPFGYTAERRMERALPGEYTAMIFRHLDKAKPLDLAAAGGARQNPLNWCAAMATSRKPMSRDTVRNAHGSKAPSASLSRRRAE